MEPKREDVLIGAIVLEDLDLIVDCVTQTLQPRDPKQYTAEIECNSKIGCRLAPPKGAARKNRSQRMQFDLGGDTRAAFAGQEPGFLFDGIAAGRPQAIDQARRSIDEQAMIGAIQPARRDFGLR